MDLQEHSSAKVVKPKRSRQPNWTEHEKELFLSLTKKHKAILENKGSNSVILSRKSEAWVEIASHMKAAGYNRSIEKLKQRLGRFRATVAKKFTERHAMFAHEEDKENSRISTSPDIMANDLNIKVEETTSATESISPPSSSILQQSNIRLVPLNLESLDTFNNARENINDGDVLHLETATNLVSQLAVDKNDNAFNLKSHSIDNVGSNEQRGEKRADGEGTPTVLSKLQASRSCRLAALRNIRATEQRNQEIHKYRVAIHRERLYALKMQRKHDRNLYLKEVEIKNLNLQALRNINNETQDENRFTF